MQPGQLDQQKRIAGRLALDGRRRARIDRLAGDRAHHPRAVELAERAEREMGDEAVAVGELALSVEKTLERRRLAADALARRPGGGDHHQTAGAAGRGQKMAEQREGVLVGPVQIVEEQHQRMGAGDPLDQTLAHAKGALAIARADRRRRLRRRVALELAQDWKQAAEEREVVAHLGELRAGEGAARDQPLHLRRRGVDHRVEGVVGHRLALAAGAAQDHAAGQLGVGAQRLGERGLADPRLAGDERHVAGAALHPIEERLEERALRVAPDELAIAEGGEAVRAELAPTVGGRRRRRARREERLPGGARRGEPLLGTLGEEL